MNDTNIRHANDCFTALFPVMFLTLMVSSSVAQMPPTKHPELIVDDFRQAISIDIFANTDDMATVRSDIKLSALKQMIDDLIISYPRDFDRGDEFLDKLAKYEHKMAEVDELLKGTPTDQEMVHIRERLKSMLIFQRKIALSHPVLNAHPILFVVRNQYPPDHHNTETFFHTGEPNIHQYKPGGALKLLCANTGTTSVLVDPGPDGLIRDPDVHFGGHKLIFSMRKDLNENYSIYELELEIENGSTPVPGQLRRLTAEPEASDIDPLYLPDGKIIFTSTREPKYCHCNMHIMANLYRMESDGANIHQISKNTLFDMHSSLLADGRVLYSRWEYVDRNFGDAQGLWTVNPDGTNHAIYWGNNTHSPAAVFDGRAIPGTDRVVCIFGACHDRPWGSMAIINRAKGIDSQEAVERIWPGVARERISIDGSDLPVPHLEDHFRAVPFRYEDPFPLTNPNTGLAGKYFLVSRNINFLPSDRTIRVTNDLNEMVMGIYLVDVFGNEILLHTERPGCFDPMPLAAHPRPGLLPEQRNFTDPTGTMYVTDVYQGTPMQDVKRGDVAFLRVVESLEKRFWTDPLWRCAQFAAKLDNGQLFFRNTLNRPAISWAGFEVKRILGTVPVEPDGSAYFEVPAETFVYFQLLDHNGMMISSMRSGAQVQPGETLGCAGCHENRLSAPPLQNFSLALKRPPDKLEGWYGAPRTFNYLSEIQPVWNDNCISCHDFGEEAGERLILAADKELVFNASYVELLQRWGTEDALLNTVGLGLAPVNPAYAVGSHSSRLVDLLRNGHYDVSLTEEELDRIISWIDIGAPYYPDYASAHPDNFAGRAPLSIPEVKRLGELTGISFDLNNPGFSNHRLSVSFDRPELSPCLQKLDKNSEEYQEALAIIGKGKLSLKENPGADMPGFKYSKKHQLREEKYRRLRHHELIRREAIQEGRKVYEHDVQ